MRSLFTNNRAGGAFGEADGCVDTPAGIFDHASRFFLSLAHNNCDRNIWPPAPVEGQRDRSALAQLIASVAPDQASALSDALLNEFGSIGRILSESEEALRRVLGSQNAVIGLLIATEKLFMAQLRNELPKKLISTTDEKLIRYLQASMGSLAIETMRVLFLDNANHLISDQVFGHGSPRKVVVPPRSILKRSLELNASAIILVHNHPGGDAKPSPSDVKFTMLIKMLCRELEIKLHDHIVIAGNKWSSFRKMKLL
ncbi:MAG: JAB domain-containing protein [Parasphingorhabdus sp.]|uniref:JAB domain-containing protein n=1 Tax=Parasphingorhabdus sp. TaxID=2709688 RepID=UPI0032975492